MDQRGLTIWFLLVCLWLFSYRWCSINLDDYCINIRLLGLFKVSSIKISTILTIELVHKDMINKYFENRNIKFSKVIKIKYKIGDTTKIKKLCLMMLNYLLNKLKRCKNAVESSDIKYQIYYH